MPDALALADSLLAEAPPTAAPGRRRAVDLADELLGEVAGPQRPALAPITPGNFDQMPGYVEQAPPVTLADQFNNAANLYRQISPPAYRGIVGEAGAGLAESALGTGRALAGGLTFAGDLARSPGLTQAGRDLSAGMGMAGAPFEQAPDAGFGTKLIRGAAGLPLTLAKAAGAGAIGGPAGVAALFGAEAAANKYDQLRHLGPEIAGQGAAQSGVLNATLGAVAPAGAVGLLPKAAQGAVVNAGVHSLASAASLAGTGLAERAIDYTTGQNPEAFKGAGEQAAVDAVLGALMPLPGEAAGMYRARAMRAVEAERAASRAALMRSRDEGGYVRTAGEQAPDSMVNGRDLGAPRYTMRQVETGPLDFQTPEGVNGTITDPNRGPARVAGVAPDGRVGPVGNPEPVAGAAAVGVEGAQRPAAGEGGAPVSGDVVDQRPRPAAPERAAEGVTETSPASGESSSRRSTPESIQGSAGPTPDGAARDGPLSAESVQKDPSPDDTAARLRARFADAGRADAAVGEPMNVEGFMPEEARAYREGYRSARKPGKVASTSDGDGSPGDRQSKPPPSEADRPAAQTESAQEPSKSVPESRPVSGELPSAKSTDPDGTKRQAKFGKPTTYNGRREVAVEVGERKLYIVQESKGGKTYEVVERGYKPGSGTPERFETRLGEGLSLAAAKKLASDPASAAVAAEGAKAPEGATKVPEPEPGSPADMASKRLEVPDDIIKSAKHKAFALEKPAYIVIARSSDSSHGYPRAAGDMEVRESASGNVAVLAVVDADGNVQWKSGRPKPAPDVSPSGKADPAPVPEGTNTDEEARQVRALAAMVGPKKVWEKLESEFLADKIKREIKRYEEAIAQQREIMAKNNGVTKRHKDAALSARLWESHLDSLLAARDGKPDTRGNGVLRKHKEEYEATIKKAISTGLPVPAEVIAQSPTFAKARDARARYDKGRDTSFGNRTAAIDDSMRAERGYKAKHQDGTPLGEPQRREIAEVVSDVEKAIGPIADLMRTTDLTIAHTQGKYPFMRGGVGGLYHPFERTVTIGVGVEPFYAHAGAHEIGHWLDFESGRAKNLKTRIYNKSGSSAETQYGSEVSSRGYGTDLSPDLQAVRSLIGDASRSMHDPSKVYREMRADPSKTADEVERARQKMMQFRLTPYWREPREIWARLFEQYVGTKLGAKTAAQDGPKYYEQTAAWWSKEEFAKLMPRVEAVIKEKIAAIREVAAPAETDAQPASTLDKIIAAADKAEKAARERIAKRPGIPRGRNTGAGIIGQELVDRAVIVAAKVLKAGVRTGRAVEKAFLAMQAELGTRFDDDAAKRIKKEAARMIRRAYEIATPRERKVGDEVTIAMFPRKKGKIVEVGKDTYSIETDEAVIEVPKDKIAKTAADVSAVPDMLDRILQNHDKPKANIEPKRAPAAPVPESTFVAQSDLPKPRETTAQRVARITGQTDLSTVTTQRAALQAVMKAQRKAANAAWRAGRKEAIAEASAQFKDLRAQFARKEATIEQVREKAIQFIEKTLPMRARGRYLRGLANTKTLEGYFRAVAKAQKHALDIAVRNAIERGKTQIAKAAKTKGLESDMKIIRDSKMELASILEQMGFERTGEATKFSKAELLRIIDRVDDAVTRAIEARANSINAKKVIIGKTVMSTHAAAYDLVNSLQGRKELPMGVDLHAAPKLGLPARYVLANRNLDSLATSTGSKVFRGMVESAWEAETRMHADTQKADDFLRKTMEEAGFKWGSNELHELSGWNSGTFAKPLTFELPDAGTVKMTAAEAMALYATLTDSKAGPQISRAGITFEGNPLAKPVNLSLADLANFTYKLDPRFREAVRAIKEYVEREVRPGLFKAFREFKGYDLEAVNEYWRTRRNLKLREFPNAPEIGETVNYALENLGFLKERVEASPLPFVIGDFFKDFNEITRQGALVTHMAREVRSLSNLIRSPEAARAMQAVYGADALRAVERHMETMQQLGRQERTGVEKGVALLNQQLAKSILTTSASAAAKNLGGVAKLAGEFSPADLASGVATAHSKEVTDVLEHGAFFRARYEGAAWRRVTASFGETGMSLGEPTLAQILQRTGRFKGVGAVDTAIQNTKGLVGQLNQLTDKIKLMDAADAQAVRVAIGSALSEGKGKGLAGAELRAFAEKRAEQVVRRTQNSSSGLDQSFFGQSQRGRLGGSFLMFTSDSNKSWNIIDRAINDRNLTAGQRAAMVGGVMANNAWAASVTTTLKFLPALAALMIGKQALDEKGEKIAPMDVVKKFASSFARNAASLGYAGEVPFNLAGASVDMADGRYPQFDSDAPIARLSSQSAEAIATLGAGIYGTGRRWFTGEDRTMKSGPNTGATRSDVNLSKGAKQAASVLYQVLGLPGMNEAKLVNRIRDAVK